MTVTNEDLKRAVINDYAKLCFSDGGTQADEITLADFKAKVETMTREELVEETWYIENDPKYTLESFVDAFLNQDQYADMDYEVHADGSSTLIIE